MKSVLHRILWMLICSWASIAIAQDEQDEASPYRAGMLAEYRDAAGAQTLRIDPEIAFNWSARSPDERMQNGPFQIRWRGKLLTQDDGSYVLSVFACGKVTIRVDGHIIMDGTAEQPNWLVAKPVDLGFGWHPLEIAYASSSAAAQISLFWSGRNFELEPVPAWHLFHEWSDENPTPRLTDFERGRQLARALRCEACHRSGAERPQILAVPSLEQITRSIHPGWLVEWLSSAPQPVETVTVEDWPRRMPHFGFSVTEATDLAAFLLRNQQRDDKRPDAEQSRVEEGRQLFLTLGCLACHGLESYGDANLFGGGDLTRIAAKRPTGFFADWLTNPASLNPQHRMPVFELSDAERAALVAFLTSLGSPSPAPAPFTDEAIRRGGELYERSRCAACHEGVPDKSDSKLSFPPPLSSALDWNRSCCAEPDVAKGRPGYRLSSSDRRALAAYFTLRKSPRDSTIDGADVLQERNCLSCHARGPTGGITTRLTALIDAFPDLAPNISALTPPSLNGVGDKLHQHAIEAAIRREGPVRRPWLRVRMPKFNLQDAERAAVIQYFIHSDRIPPDHPQRREILSANAPEEIGARLVTPDGFGCTSCHAVGSVKAPNAPIHTLGPDLLMLDQRIRREWFERWVRNPARIVPRMEMPSVQTPVSGALENNLNLQLAAVWETLNRPEFRPPDPRPVRVVRRSGDAKLQERAVVLTDVIQHASSTHIKPLVVALPNRHNVLLDLQECSIAGWWFGDAARQRTRGKSWYWESSAPDIHPGPVGETDLVLIVDDRALHPLRSGQFVTEFDKVQHLPEGGVSIQHRVRYANDSSTNWITFSQHFLPEWDVRDHGWRRQIEARNLPPGSRVRVDLFDAKRAAAVAQFDERIRQFSFPDTGARLQIRSPQHAHLNRANAAVEVPESQGLARLEIAYTYGAPLDIVDTAAVVDDVSVPRMHPPEEIKAVPGFVGVRLPTRDEIMPTGFTWDPDGELLFSSLKGQVWRLRDSDVDGLEDQLLLASDELAAPYGLVAGAGYVDVINKYALLRLLDHDHDGFAESMVTLASGWGHTSDYHDWAVGLLSDGNGGYTIALPCQQDERSADAAYLRGTVLQLQPRTSASEDPRKFDLQPISGGHRFPMGLARSKMGELFVTDNQGNYNPFNELNHVRAGAHFGFINALERNTDFQPPPLAAPAINIPHPWMRSVNGICFLNTPDSAGRSAIFGPFEGHLVGCEFDTRRLVRMSLERIGDAYQGAVYPFSIDQPDAGGTFIGPLVAQVSPRGELYIGCVRDSGWGGSNNVGSIVRLTPDSERLPAGIAEVQSRPNGFRIVFTQLVDRARASSIESYSVSSYRRISTPDYGGPDVDRRLERPIAVHVAQEGRYVDLEFSELRTGCVYEIHLRNLTEDGELFFPAEAHYTLNHTP